MQTTCHVYIDKSTRPLREILNDRSYEKINELKVMFDWKKKSITYRFEMQTSRGIEVWQVLGRLIYIWPEGLSADMMMSTDAPEGMDRFMSLRNGTMYWFKNRPYKSDGDMITLAHGAIV